MKIPDFEFSNVLRNETDFRDFVSTVSSIINSGRYQMRIISSVPTWTGEGGEFLLFISGTIRRWYWYDSINSTWQFIEWNTSGVGQPIIVASVDLTAQKASIGTTTLYTPATSGVYRVSVYQLCTKAGGAGTLDTTIGWTDDAQAQTVVPCTQVNLNGKGNGSYGTVVARSTASAITYSTTLAGGAGSPEYGLWITVERLT